MQSDYKAKETEALGQGIWGEGFTLTFAWQIMCLWGKCDSRENIYMAKVIICMA